MKSIKDKLTKALLLSFMVLFVIGGLAVFITVQASLSTSFNDALVAKALALASLTEYDHGRIELELSDQFLRDFTDPSVDDFFQMWINGDTVLERSPSLNGGDLPKQFGTASDPVFWDLALASSPSVRAVGIKFIPKKEADPRNGLTEVSLVVASNRSELDRTLVTLAGILLGTFLFLGISAGILIPRLLNHGLKPLGAVADHADSITADTLDAHFSVEELPIELQPIAMRLNELTLRLNESFENEKRFSGDLAHELRTPISELKALAEVAIEWPDKRDANIDHDVLAISKQMEGLTDRILKLMRADERQNSVSIEKLSLNCLIKNTLDNFNAKIAEKKIDVRVDINGPYEIESDLVLIRSIITNLIQNAVEYTPQNGDITVYARVHENGFEVELSNTTKQLDAVDLTHMFDRLWRKDSSRTDGNHSGLGLSLAKSYAQILGYELEVKLLEEGQRIVFRLGFDKSCVA